jgi:tetratricopeptide (TPR) repeat protein
MQTLLRRPPVLLSILLVVLAIAAFGWGVLHAQFISLDDGILITSNGTVQIFNIHSIWHAFTSYDPELYVPLTLFSYQLEHAVFGLNPVVFHTTNLLLHIGSALFLFQLARMLLGRDIPAFAVAALFAIHPLNTEAVMWAAARKDVLSTFFFLLTLFLYERGVRHNRYSLIVWSIVTFTLALLSKATVLMLPLILILLDWLSHRRVSIQSIIAKWPWFSLSGIFAIIAFFGKTRNLSSLSPFDLLLIGLKSVVFYLQKLLWPAPLSVVYEQSLPISQTDPQFFVPALIVLALIAVAVALRKHRIIPFGIAFFLLSVFPNFFNVWKNGMLFFASDRYAYVASIGIFFIVAWLFSRTEKFSAMIPAVVTGLLCIVLLPVSYAQSLVWRDSETLYRHALTTSPTSPMLLVNLGNELVQSKRIDEGITLFQKAIQVMPNNVTALTNIGNLLKLRGDRAGALGYYQRAKDATPENPFPEQLVGFYLLGQMLIENGDVEQGLTTLKLATERGAKFAEPSFNYGLMLEQLGRKEAAVDAFQEAVRREGNYLAARYHLAALLAERGELEEATAQLEYIVARDPHYEKAAEHLRNIRGLR